MEPPEQDKNALRQRIDAMTPKQNSMSEATI
jgi:hypothetical protein